MQNIKQYYAPEDVKRWQTLALFVGAICSIAILAVALFSPASREQALRSWLLGFIFWAGIGFGGLGILILQYLTGGAWGVVIRRTLEAASRTWPVILVLFIPVAVGITSIYEWTQISPAADKVIAHRGWYLTTGGWWIRSAVYFAIFAVLAWVLNRYSKKQDEAATAEESAKILEKSSKFSGPTMVLFALTVSFASIDWMMTLDPHWYSTIWGLLFVAGWALSCYCFIVAILALLADKPPMDRVLGSRHFHDLGKLMLALVMVWAYFNFSQYLIIWSGNIPEESSWYIVRMKEGWGYIGVILIFFHFAFPFLVLLHQDLKRRARWLATLAVFILILRIIDMYYIIGPSPRLYLHVAEPSLWTNLSWMDFIAPVGVGGIWLWAFFGQLLKRPMVPINDPYLQPAIEHGRGH